MTKKKKSIFKMTKKEIKIAAEDFVKNFGKNMAAQYDTCPSCKRSKLKIEKRCHYCSQVRARSRAEGRIIYI